MSGWTAVTLNFDSNEQRDQIDEELREAYPYDDGGGRYATGYADTTIQVERGAIHSTVATKFAQEYPEATYIAVVSANDTSDSGHGTLYRVTLSNDGSRDERFNLHPIKKIDSKQGYEGARGSDVTGYFKDEHGVRSYESFEA